MAAEWYFRVGGSEFGPFTPPELIQQAAAGRIATETEVRKGDGAWVSAAKVAGLFGRSARAKAAPNPPTTMPGRNRKIPAYRLYKPTGQAVVRNDGRDFYLGKHGTDQSRQAYDRRIVGWLSLGRAALPGPRDAGEAGPGLSVNGLAVALRDEARRRYRRPDGTLGSEVEKIKLAIRPLSVPLIGDGCPSDRAASAGRPYQDHAHKAGLAGALPIYVFSIYYFNVQKNGPLGPRPSGRGVHPSRPLFRRINP